MSKQVFLCEKCEKVFPNHYECTLHESLCLDLKTKIKLEFEKAVNRVKSKYNLEIKHSYTDVWVDECHGFVLTHVSIELELLLPNDNKAQWIDSYYDIDAANEDGFYAEIEQLCVLPYLDLVYEGTVDGYQGYESDFMINGIEVGEIFRRLRGKRVRIEAFND